MSLIRWSPLLEPFEAMDSFFGNFPATSNVLGGFVPSLDIYQDEKNVIVEAPLAGVKPEDVKISLENDVLTIEGKTASKSEVDEKNYWRKEVRSGFFHRSVALPVSVNESEVRAEYESGMLKIVLPKEEKVKPKTVHIDIKGNNY